MNYKTEVYHVPTGTILYEDIEDLNKADEQTKRQNLDHFMNIASSGATGKSPLRKITDDTEKVTLIPNKILAECTLSIIRIGAVNRIESIPKQ